MNAPWEFQLLGRRCATRGSQIVTRFSSSRVAALLARLALFPQRDHPREELIDLLWPDSDLASGRLNLRVALASLRRQIEPPDVLPGSVLVADRTVLRLHPAGYRCDVAAFEAALKEAARAPTPLHQREALDRAIGLFAGELLPSFYDDWIVEERERLNALLEDALDQRETLPKAAPPAEQRLTLPQAALPVFAPLLLGFPVQFTRFFGREAETAEIGRRLSDPATRLVTLTGPGGSGKTRLAVETVRQAHGFFSGPICFVALADLADASSIPDAIASSLCLVRSATEAASEQIAAYLSTLPPALLVLDNFEHLVERGAPLLFSLLSRLPTLTCLVTSRRRLALPGEREFPVPPLPVPGEGGTAEEVARTPSAQLFADRAQAARPDFQITAGNAAAVAALCRTLEGIPLALELAAARTPALTPTQMNERLKKRFELLTSRRGDKGGRHRSLWAALAWSYDLLGPELQRFFTGLSVFRGGWTVEAALAVCEEPQALEYLTQLRERSLVVIEEAPGEMRFRLLETLREFGEEQLDDQAQEELSRCHADWYTALAREAWPQITGPQQASWLHRLEADYENLRVTQEFWLTAEADDETATEAALEICGCLWRFWSVRGHYAAGVDWQRRALARSGGLPYTRARAANGAGNLARLQGDYPGAEAFYTEALEIMRRLGLTTSVGACLCNLGIVAMNREDYLRAEALQAEALTLRQGIGDTGGVAFTLQCQAVTAQHKKDFQTARRLHEESLGLWVSLNDDLGRLWAVYNLASIAGELGEWETANAFAAEALEISLTLENSDALHGLLAIIAGLFAHRGDWQKAIRLYSAAESLRRRIGVSLSPKDASDQETKWAEARGRLSETDFAAEWSLGAAMTTEEAIACAQQK